MARQDVGAEGSHACRPPLLELVRFHVVIPLIAVVSIPGLVYSGHGDDPAVQDLFRSVQLVIELGFG